MVGKNKKNFHRCLFWVGSSRKEVENKTFTSLQSYFFMEAYKYALFLKNIKSDTLFIKIIGYKKLRSIIKEILQVWKRRGNKILVENRSLVIKILVVKDLRLDFQPQIMVAKVNVADKILDWKEIWLKKCNRTCLFQFGF